MKLYLFTSALLFSATIAAATDPLSIQQMFQQSPKETAPQGSTRIVTVRGSTIRTFSLSSTAQIPPIFTGTGLSVGKVYYLGLSGLALAQGNSISTMPGVCIATSATVCIRGGSYQAAGTIGNGNIGSAVYVSPTITGGMTTTAPSSGQYMNIVGTLTAPNVIAISPSLDVFGL